MKIIFIISAQFLMLFALLSCGRDSDSSSGSISAQAPRYRALLVDENQDTLGTVVLREDEDDIQSQVNVVSSSLRRSLESSLIIEGPCPAPQETPSPEVIRFDLGKKVSSSLKLGSNPPPLGGHSVLLVSQNSSLACGALVPIPQE